MKVLLELAIKINMVEIIPEKKKKSDNMVLALEKLSLRGQRPNPNTKVENKKYSTTKFHCLIKSHNCVVGVSHDNSCGHKKESQVEEEKNCRK